MNNDIYNHHHLDNSTFPNSSPLDHGQSTSKCTRFYSGCARGGAHSMLFPHRHGSGSTSSVDEPISIFLGHEAPLSSITMVGLSHLSIGSIGRLATTSKTINRTQKDKDVGISKTNDMSSHDTIRQSDFVSARTDPGTLSNGQSGTMTEAAGEKRTALDPNLELDDIDTLGVWTDNRGSFTPLLHFECPPIHNSYTPSRTRVDHAFHKSVVDGQDMSRSARTEACTTVVKHVSTASSLVQLPNRSSIPDMSCLPDISSSPEFSKLANISSMRSINTLPHIPSWSSVLEPLDQAPRPESGSPAAEEEEIRHECRVEITAGSSVSAVDPAISPSVTDSLRDFAEPTQVSFGLSITPIKSSGRNTSEPNTQKSTPLTTSQLSSSISIRDSYRASEGSSSRRFMHSTPRERVKSEPVDVLKKKHDSQSKRRANLSHLRALSGSAPKAQLAVFNDKFDDDWLVLPDLVHDDATHSTVSTSLRTPALTIGQVTVAIAPTSPTHPALASAQKRSIKVKVRMGTNKLTKVLRGVKSRLQNVARVLSRDRDDAIDITF